MKNSTVRLIVWSVVALVILALMLVLFFRPSLLSNIDISVPTVSAMTYENAGRYTSGGGETSGVSEIDIEWLGGRIDIVPYGGSTVVIEETAAKNLPEKEQVHWFNNNGKLMIKYAASGLRTTSNISKSLTVKIPTGMSLKELDIDSVSAEVKVTGLEITEFKVTSVSGEVTASDITGRELDFEAVSGDMSTNGLDFDTLDFNTVSGEVTVGLAEKAEPKEISVESVSGEINILMPENLGFSADFDSVSGDIGTDCDIASLSKKGIVSGNGAVKIDAESVSGDLNINKLR